MQWPSNGESRCGDKTLFVLVSILSPRSRVEFCMAVRLLNGEISELCLGKPQLTALAANDTVSDALKALKACGGDTHVSVWACESTNGSCTCVGKVSVADVILFLCKEDYLSDPFKALEAPVSDLLPKGGTTLVRHVDPNSSLLEAIDYILEGTQNLVIPIQNHQFTTNPRKKSLNKQSCPRHKYCWLTQEDIIRYILNSIGAFTPIPSFTIDSLDVIDRDIMTIHYKKPASSALAYFHRALAEQTSVAVVDDENRFIGEISPYTLACCDETVAAAIMALTAGELMSYIDCGAPTEDSIHLVKVKLEEKRLNGMVEFVDESFLSLMSSSSSCSSDDEFGLSRSARTRSGGSGRHYPARRHESVVCSPRSTLAAVMIQALAHRISCAWVVEDDHTLVGTVSSAEILRAFRSVAGGRHNDRRSDNSV